MYSRDDVNHLLSSLASQLNLGELTLDENDTASLNFNDEGELLFEFSLTQGSLMLWAPLCSLEIAESAAEERALLRHVLSLGYPAQLLGGAHTALNEDGVLLLAKPALASVAKPEVFTEECQAFANAVLAVIEELKSRSWAAPEGLTVNLAPRGEMDLTAGSLRI